MEDAAASTRLPPVTPIRHRWGVQVRSLITPEEPAPTLLPPLRSPPVAASPARSAPSPTTTPSRASAPSSDAPAHRLPSHSLSASVRAKLDRRFLPRVRVEEPPRVARNRAEMARDHVAMGRRSSLSKRAVLMAGERRKSVVQLAAVMAQALRAPQTVSGTERRVSQVAVRVAQTKKTVQPQRIFHSGENVAAVHGTLIGGTERGQGLGHRQLKKLSEETGFSRRELFHMWIQFKALVAMSPSLEGVDKETFRRGIPTLALEDDTFVDRVFSLLDEDGSGTIEWDEFIRAMTKLEKGTRRERGSFLFDVYDRDGGGTISEGELLVYLLGSLRLTPDSTSGPLVDMCQFFTQELFRAIDPAHSGEITREQTIAFVEAHPEIRDIGVTLGRAVVPASATFEMLKRFANDVRAKEIRAKRAATGAVVPAAGDDDDVTARVRARVLERIGAGPSFDNRHDRSSGSLLSRVSSFRTVHEGAQNMQTAAGGGGGPRGDDGGRISGDGGGGDGDGVADSRTAPVDGPESSVPGPRRSTHAAYASRASTRALLSKRVPEEFESVGTGVPEDSLGEHAEFSVPGTSRPAIDVSDWGETEVASHSSSDTEDEEGEE